MSGDDDPDNDGLSTTNEYAKGTSPTDPDSDDDRLLDGDEIVTSPTNPDSDGDGLKDGDEVLTYFTDATDPDTDNDGVSDRIEIEIHDSSPFISDSDFDGIGDHDEDFLGMNLTSVDSDGDGIDDDYEDYRGWDPLDPDDAVEDDDEDGFSNLAEYIDGWNPSSAASSNDIPVYRFVCRNPGTNTVRYMIGNSPFRTSCAVFGDAGDASATVRIPPPRQIDPTTNRQIRFSGGSGFTINGSAVTGMSQPIEIAPSATSLVWKVCATKAAQDTTLEMWFCDYGTTNRTGSLLNLRAPKIDEVEFRLKDNRYVDVEYGETNTLYAAAGTNGHASVWVTPHYENDSAYGGPLYMCSDYTLARVSGDVTNFTTTVNWADYRSAYRFRTGISLPVGIHEVAVGFDWDLDGDLGDDEVTEVCEVVVISACFIDETPDYSLDTNADSDNFFLREYDASQDLDSEDLDIYYRIHPEGLNVSDVKIKVYRGDTTTVEATLVGEKDESGEFETGDNLHTNWNASVNLGDNHPGFYRLQLEVYVDTEIEPVYTTPVDDADASIDGWQCPQDCLAVHDLTWKHRPVLHVHEDEIGTPSSIDEFMAESGDATGPRVKEWTGGSTPTIHPAGTIPTSVTAFWDLFFDDQVSDGDLSNYTPAELAILTTDAGEETLYHSANTTNATDFVFLQFWMFENFSRRPFGILGLPANPNVQHEGDMEHCQIAIRLADQADSSNKARWIEPFGATVSQHYYAQTLKWDLNDGSAAANAHSQERVEHTGGRLAIYVSLGAHATYFAEDQDIEVPDINAHLGTQQQYDGNPEGAYDITGPAVETDYELAHIDDVLLGSFEGRWGYLRRNDPGSFANGPPGPPHRSAHDDAGADVLLRTRPRDLHNMSRKTSQLTEMNIP